MFENPGPCFLSACLDIYEEGEGFPRVGIKDAVIGTVVEFGGWVLVFEDFDYGVNVEGCEGSVSSQACGVVSHIEIVIE